MLTARKNFFSALSRSDPPVKEERKGPQVDPRVTVFVGMYPECSVVRSRIRSIQYDYEYGVYRVYIDIYILSGVYIAIFICPGTNAVVYRLYRCSRPASLQPISGGREKR